MAARNTPAKGSKPDKLWRDALAVAVKRPIGEPAELPRTRLAAMAEKLIEKALEGDVPALKEIGDRLDGKPTQAVDMQHNAGDSLKLITQVIDRLDAPGAEAAVAALRASMRRH